MLKRLITAFVMIAIVGAVIYFNIQSTFVLSIFINLVIILATIELCHAFEHRICMANKILLTLFSASTFIIYNFLGMLELCYFAIIIFAICSAITMFAKGDLQQLGLVALLLVYPMMILSTGYVINNDENNLFYLMMVLAVPVATDTLAFFLGSLIKGKKLIPYVSPKKTISGAVSGLFGGILASLLVYFMYNPVEYPWWLFVIVGFGGSIFSQIGDLVESFIKRQINKKDMSNLLPGHGGIMDRLDSIMFNLLFTFFVFFTIL